MATSNTSITTPMSATTTIPTSTPASPTATEEPRKRGLTLTTTIGVGIGIAVLCILIFAIAFICIRRRRRKWGKKRKEQGEPAIEGDTPEEEIAKKTDTVHGTVGIADGETKRAELAGGHVDADKKERMMEGGTMQELDAAGEVAEMGTESKVHELAGNAQLAEVGEGGGFIAELDGTDIERRKTLMDRKRRLAEETEPLPKIEVSKPQEEK